MFKNIGEFISGKETLQVDRAGSPTSHDLQLAIVGLLAHTAQLDKSFNSDEFNAVVHSLQREFEIKDYEVGSLLEVSDFLMSEGDKSAQFARTVRDNFDEFQRQILLAMVWKVIIADGIVDKFEASFAAKLRDELGLTLEEAVRARTIAEQEENPLVHINPHRD